MALVGGGLRRGNKEGQISARPLRALKGRLKARPGSSRCGSVGYEPTRNPEYAGSIPGLVQWIRDPALL